VANDKLIFDILKGKDTLKVGVKENATLVKKLSSEIKKSFSIASFTGNLAANAVASFAGVLRQGLSNSIDFGKGIAEINSILPRNEKLTKKSEKAILGLSSTFGLNAQTQAKAFYNIVSAGVEGTTNQLETLRVANEAAVAGLVNIDTSARALVSSVNAYASAGETATSISDKLFQAVKDGQTTFGELADTVGRVAPLANSAGLEFSEMAGTLAFLTKSGINTAQSVTGLRQTLSGIIKPTSEAVAEAKKLGIEFSTAGIKQAGGFAEFLKLIKDRSRGSTDSLAKLFGSVEALNAVLAITNGDFDDFNKVLENNRDSMGSTETAAKELKGTLDFKLSQASQSLQNLTTSFISDMTPAMFKAAEVAADLFGFLAGDEEPKGLKAAQKELDELIAKKEGFTSGDGGILKAIFGGGVAPHIVEQTNRAIEQQTKLVTELQQAKAANGSRNPSANGGLPETVDAENDPKVLQEKAVQAKLLELGQEFAMTQQELAIAKREINGEQRAGDLERIQAFETSKLEATINAKELEIRAIEDSVERKRKLAQFEIKAETEKTKLIIKQKQELAAREDQISSSRLRATENFLSAGISLVKQGSKEQRVLQSAQAVVSTYTAATQALASPPGPPFTIPLAASVVAQGIANVARINSQKFADGGVVGGTSFTGDKVPAFVNSGEAILNKQQGAEVSAGLKENKGLSEKIDELIRVIKSQPVILQINGNEIARAVRDSQLGGFQLG